MSKIFITGDRNMPAELALATAAVEVLKATANGDTVATGVAPGVEQAVRSVADAAGVSIGIFETPELADNAPVQNSPWDFVSRHENSEADRVVAIHPAPEASKMIAQLTYAGVPVETVAPYIAVVAL